MVAALIVFVVVSGLVMGAFYGLQQLPGYLASRRLDRRLREVSRPLGTDLPDTPSFITEVKKGPLPAIDRALGGANSSLATLIEQSGVQTTPSAIMLMMVLAALASGILCMLFIKVPIFWIIAALGGSFLPYIWLRFKRTQRLKKFEEQFPEALDLLSRAIRAGHAFQTAMGMVADEMPAPVGVEFKKAFEQQNFGLPLRDVLDQMAERVPILDVKFFVTAVDDSARDRRQPGRNPRQPRPRRARALQDPAAGARAHRARPLHRLRPAGAAGIAGRCAHVHQPGAHESALHRAHGPDDDPRGHRDAVRWLSVD